MSTPKKTGSVLDVPMAVTSGGRVLVGLTYLIDGDPLEVARRLIADGHEVFLGIAIPRHLRGELLRGIEDGAADLVGRLGPQLRRRKARR